MTRTQRLSGSRYTSAHGNALSTTAMVAIVESHSTIVIRHSSSVTRRSSFIDRRFPNHLRQRVAAALTIGQPGQRRRRQRPMSGEFLVPLSKLAASQRVELGWRASTQMALQIGQGYELTLSVFGTASHPAVAMDATHGRVAQRGGKGPLRAKAGFGERGGSVHHFDQSTTSCLRPVRNFSTAMPATAPSAAAITACLT